MSRAAVRMACAGAVPSAVAAFAIACHHPAARIASSTTIPVQGTAISAMGAGGAARPAGVRITGIDTLDQSARFTLAAPAYVIVLDVRPGTSIDLVEPSDVRSTAHRAAGTYRTPLSTRDRDIQEAVDDDLARCTTETTVTASVPSRPQPKPTKGSGKPGEIPQEAYAAPPRPSLERCKARAQQLKVRLTQMERGAQALAGVHYLVVLATEEKQSPARLMRQLAELTTTGADAGTAIEALAYGLLGIDGWSGYYVAR